MNREQYIAMMGYLEDHPAIKKTINLADSLITKVAYVVYPLLIIGLFVGKNPGVWKAILIPAVSFAVLSLFRHFYDSPRPYEVYGIPSALSKDTLGKSFPSRHVFSCFVIAFTLFFFYPLCGYLLMGLGAVMAVIRVLGGVHFVRDVIVGGLFGVLSAVIGFWFV